MDDLNLLYRKLLRLICQDTVTKKKIYKNIDGVRTLVKINPTEHKLIDWVKSNTKEGGDAARLRIRKLMKEVISTAKDVIEQTKEIDKH